MRVELPILSFICLALLIALIPLHFKSRNIAILSIIFWLLAGNIIQGVNGIIWARDAHVRGTPWCDIVTKLLLATRVALPAACACICRHLYILSSSLEPKRRPHRTAFECSICFVFPLLYMAFHTLVQPRRFDLISSFGCLPSIYASVPALILVWLPILVFCVTTIFYSALALNSHIRRSAGPSDDGRFPSQLINLTFLRPLLQSMTISIFILSATVFAMYVHIKMSGGLLPWKSWSQVHAKLSEVNVLDDTVSRLDISRIKVEFLTIPVSTFVFALTTLLGAAYGPTRDSESLYGLKTVGRWFNTAVLRRSVSMESFVDSSKAYDGARIVLTSPTPTAVDLTRSVWEDTLKSNSEKVKATMWGYNHSKPNVDIDIPASPSSSDTESDASFIASTLKFVDSPTGRQALGLPPQINVMTPTQLPSPTSSNLNRLSVVPSQTTPLSESPSSVTHSILAEPWPQPPSELPTSPVSPQSLQSSPTIPNRPNVSTPPAAHMSPYSKKSRPPSIASCTGSMASSTISNQAYGVSMYDPSLVKPHRPPFQGSSTRIPLDDSEWENVLTTEKSNRIRKLRSKESLSRSHIGLGLKARERKEEGIYMTVVQETV